MKVALSFLLALRLATAADVAWSHYPTNSSTPWPTANGYISIFNDPVSHTVMFYVTHASFTGQVSVTNGSAVVTWVSGDKFGPNWPSPTNIDTIIIGGVTYNILAASITTCAPLCTQVSLSANYSGATSGSVLYSVNPSNIYSTDIYAYTSASSHTFALIPGGSGSVTSGGTSDANSSTDTATWMRDSQPSREQIYDTTRHAMWFLGGINTGTPIVHTYYCPMNANPLLVTCSKLTLAHTPQSPTGNSDAAAVYDSDDDVIFWWGSDTGFGNHNHYVYARTLENPTPGVLTAAQLSTGAIAADDWTEIPLTIGNCVAGFPCSAKTVSCSGAACSNSQPPGSGFPALVYDTATQRIIQMGGSHGSVVTNCAANSGGAPICNATFSYAPHTATWTQKTDMPAIGEGAGTNPWTPALAYIPAAQVIYYHYLDATHGGPVDYKYVPSTDTWSTLTSSGTGPSLAAFSNPWGYTMDYDVASNRIIAYSQGSGDLWEGQLPTAPVITTSSPLPTGYVGVAYSTTLAASGTTPLTWSLASGSLPTGLTLNTSTGAITGTPSGSPGMASFTIGVTNGTAPDDSKPFTLTIGAACTISTTSLPNGTVNITYSQAVATSNCVSPAFAITVGTLPTGLNIGVSTGVITGTPVTAATSSFTVGVTDAAGVPTKALSIQIDPGPTILPVGSVLRSVIR